MTYMTSGPDYEYDEPQMRKKTIETLWHEFGDVGIDDNDRIDSSFCGWEFGTDRFEIWHWFDAQYAKWGGVHALMYPEEHKAELSRSRFGIVSATVDLQAWVNDYAVTLETVEFDCGSALDTLPFDMVEKFEPGEAGYDTDNIYYAASELGLVKEHDGPFDCYIEDGDELEAYIEARKERAC